MKRLLIIAASVSVIGGGLIITSASASAEVNKDIVLYGQIDGLKSEGTFPAIITIKDPVSGQVLAQSRTSINFENGKYKASVKTPHRLNDAAYKVSMEGLGSAKDFNLIEYVELQAGSPGTQQTGHINISGYVLADRVGLGVSPSLAKLQINETGSNQGVRSITNTGVAVYGQATATSGLASGGYFTSSSIGGRAMVGDALSTTGSTVGGLFYNRSSDGVAVWGRHINSSGTSIGVLGQTASSGGTAIMAENTSTGSTVELAGPNGSLMTSGILPRHKYTTSNAAAMVPIAYGTFAGSGGVLSAGSGNWTCSKVSSGTYDIDVQNQTGVDIVVGTSYQSGSGQIVTSSSNNTTGDFRLLNWSLLGVALNDSAITFVAYKADASSTARSLMPKWAKDKYNGNITAWEKADPQGFESYRLARLEAERKASQVRPVEIPYDEAEPAGQPGERRVLPPQK